MVFTKEASLQISALLKYLTHLSGFEQMVFVYCITSYMCGHASVGMSLVNKILSVSLLYWTFAYRGNLHQMADLPQPPPCNHSNPSKVFFSCYNPLRIWLAALRSIVLQFNSNYSTVYQGGICLSLMPGNARNGYRSMIERHWQVDFSQKRPTYFGKKPQTIHLLPRN